jgi:hypothetical protein
MLNRLAVIAVLLAVTQALVPASGKTPDNNRGNARDAQGDPAPSQTEPADPKAIPQSPHPNAPQGEPRSAQEENNQKSITVGQQASVPIRDWIDYTTLAIGSLLALITGAGVIAAWKGLPDFKRQAKAAEDAANAALKQASHIETSERAWMSAVMENPPETHRPGSALRLACHIKNMGKTPAFLLEKGEDRQVLKVGVELPHAPPQYVVGTKWKGIGVMFPPTAEIAVALDLSVSEARTVYEGTHAIWFYGFLKYRDAFKKDRIIRYCFRYSLPEAGSVSSGFYPDGPDGYNYAD